MPFIEIIENDETSAGTYAEATDVVYIPGFVDITQECLYAHDQAGKRIGYIGIKVHEPTLFTSVKDFETLCGTKGAVFSEDQHYSSLDKTFTSAARPDLPYQPMFEEGTIDPSYIMAKELLAAGLNVVYERVNDDNSEEYHLITVKPDDWDATYFNYYKDEEGYTPLTGNTAPGAWYEPFVSDKAFTLSKDKKSVTMTYELADTETLGYTAKWVPGLIKNSTLKLTLNPEKDIYTNGDNVTISITDPAEENPLEGEALLKKACEDFYIQFSDFEEGRAIQIATFKQGTDIITNFNKTSVVVSKGPSENTVQFKEDGGFAKPYYLYTGEVYIEPELNEETGETIYLAENNITLNQNGVIQVVPEDWANKYYEHAMPATVKVTVEKEDSFEENNIYELRSNISIKKMYTELDTCFDSGNIDGLIDKGNISIKYLTSGGYPTVEYDNNSLAVKMINIAESRGDCVAILDHTNKPERTTNINTEANIYNYVKSTECQSLHSEFATMFTPWAEYARTTTDKDIDASGTVSVIKDKSLIGLSSVELPGSYAYLITLADSIQTNANWLAVAGSARGVVKNLAAKGMKVNITNGSADAMQPRDAVAINAITNIKPYGYTIWGNRTLKNNGEKGNLTATSFLNVRNLISDVKKRIYRVARQLTFEQNNDVLWVNFKSLISSLLDQMLSGYGISGYKIVRDNEHEKASEKATICAKVILYPTYAVEDFYITIVLKDDEVTVE